MSALVKQETALYFREDGRLRVSYDYRRELHSCENDLVTTNNTELTEFAVAECTYYSNRPIAMVNLLKLVLSRRK